MKILKQFGALTQESKSGGWQKGSLTVEAALVLPVFLYFMLAFLYYLQIFTVQEQIQSAITKMGLNLSKTAYVMKDFTDLNSARDFDFTIFEDNFDINPKQLAEELASSYVLKHYARKYLDTEQINHSCIEKGFEGLSFQSSGLISKEDYIDIVVSYQIEAPIKIFAIKDRRMLQRVRLRSWTGREVEAAYREEGEEQGDGTAVFITETGSVYHRTESCSHIKLSITAVQGIPTELRNDNGGKYYPCESCCVGAQDQRGTFYITSDGTRYHSRRECSRIKRSVRKILIREAGERTPCKRCYQN